MRVGRRPRGSAASGPHTHVCPYAQSPGFIYFSKTVLLSGYWIFAYRCAMLPV